MKPATNPLYPELHAALADKKAQQTAGGTAINAVMPLLMTTDEAAAFLGIRPDTLYRWRKDQRGPSFVKSRGFIRYTQAALISWVSAGGDTSNPITE